MLDPAGKGFIAYEDIPEAVAEAFAHLQEKYSHMVRKANSEYVNVRKK